MAHPTKILIAGLLACLFGGIFARKMPYDTILNYEIDGTEDFQLGPKGKKITVTYDMKGQVRPMNEDSSILSITMSDLNMFVDRGDAKQMNLTTCKSNEALQNEIKRPFLAFFNDNGVLHYIKADRRESEMSLNTKLYGATLLQLDLPQLRGETGPNNRNGLTYAGSCPKRSEVIKTTNGTTVNRFTANMTECSEVERDYRRDGLPCLYNTCRYREDRNLRWTAVREVEVANVDGRPVSKNLELKMPVSYSPFSESDVQLRGNILIRSRLVSIGKARDPPNFKQYRGGAMNRVRYMNINRSICEGCARNKDDKDDLREMYSALVCQESMAVIYEDVLNRAIECN